MPKQTKQGRKTSAVRQVPTDETNANPDRSQIALRAYHLWQERGCPIGSPEEDWNRAEIELQLGAGAAADSQPSPAVRTSTASGK